MYQTVLNASSFQNEAGEGDAGFTFFEDDIGCSSGTEAVAIGEVSCTDDDFDIGVELARVEDEGGEAFGEGKSDDEMGGLGDAGFFKDGGLGGIAVEGRAAGAGERLHGLYVHVDDDGVHLCVAKHGVDDASDGTVSGDDCEGAAGVRSVLRGLVVERLGTTIVARVEQRMEPGKAANAGLDRIEGTEEERIEGDGDHGSGDKNLHARLGDELVLKGGLTDDEGEFADLGESEGHGESGSQRISAEGDDDHRGDRLDDEDDKETCGDKERLLNEECGVEEHADRDEEEDGKGVAEGECVRGGLMAYFGLCNDHACEEGTEGD